MFTGAAFFAPHIAKSLFSEVMALPYHIYVLATAGTFIEETRPIQYGTVLVLLLLAVLGICSVGIFMVPASPENAPIRGGEQWKKYRSGSAKNVNLITGRPAPGDVSADILEKNVTALIGPSGCGKSTFPRCINRMNDFIPSARFGWRNPNRRHRHLR